MEELIKIITDNGTTIVLAAVWILISIQQSRREAIRVKRMEESITPTMIALKQVVEDSIVEKTRLAIIIDGYKEDLRRMRESVERIILLYERSMDRVDLETSADIDILDTLKYYGRKMDEIIQSVAELRAEYAQLKRSSQNE